MVAMATILMVCLGTVYAWSYFQTPIMESYGWNNSQVSLTFSLAIFFLGLSAAVGGVFLPKLGPRTLALSGSILFSVGYAISGMALSIPSLPLLYLGYGVIGGTGLGLGYVTPVATIVKWFPDKKGLATGIVVMGFGFGALMMSKILAPSRMAWTNGNLVSVFFWLALVFAVLTIIASLSLANPVQANAEAPLNPAQAFQNAKPTLVSGRFILVWIMFFCNITAGIAVVGFQSPMFQELLKSNNSALSPAVLVSMGATLIAITSLFNGFGRFLWGAVSDRAGRIKTYRIMLRSQLVVFLLLAITGNPWIFTVLVCWILLCYGGGFGTMPATISELFGAERMTVVYGVVLTAWAAGGVVGPQITAFLKDKMPERASSLSFVVGAVFVALGFVASLFIGRKEQKRDSR
jgi:OFA family oxalate/formate antiporter-like MFS transporter